MTYTGHVFAKELIVIDARQSSAELIEREAAAVCGEVAACASRGVIEGIEIR